MEVSQTTPEWGLTKGFILVGVCLVGGLRYSSADGNFP